MIDQYHLRRVVHNAKNALRLLDLDTEEVNWRQYAIMLLHSPNADKLQEKLVRRGRGWFRHNQGEHYPTSLYLSPKGQPFYLGYADHGLFVCEFMGLRQHDLDMAGWLHISGGRVDIPVGLTRAQRDWLAANPPHMGVCWDERTSECPKATVPYPAAEKFDIRPSDDDGRFYMRLYKEYAGPPIVTVSHGVQSCA